jgi:hypothetical protein
LLREQELNLLSHEQAIHLMEKPDPVKIHPEIPGNLHYWSRRWGVSPKEVMNAILFTGSLSTTSVKEYLRRDSWFYHPVKGSLQFFRSTIQYIF